MKISVPVVVVALLCAGCSPILIRMVSRTFSRVTSSPEPAVGKTENPVLDDVGISVIWVGHATMLIQIHDKIFLTDPVFTKTVGMIATRFFEPGLDPSKLSRVDYTLISHPHFDHFSLSSLDMIPKDGTLLLPFGEIGRAHV